MFLAAQKNDDLEREKVADLWSEQFESNIKTEDINCDGCLSADGKLFAHCNTCEIRKCGMERHVQNCAYCSDYFCEKLDKFVRQVTIAKTNLEKIRARM